MNRQRIRIKRGLDLPMQGTPSNIIEDGAPVRSVGLLGPNHHGLKPRMHVAEGDRVRLGDPLFSDKSTPGVIYTAPGCGTVTKINRGQRRALQSVVIELDGDDEVTFERHSADSIAGLAVDKVVEQLLQSGLWTGLQGSAFQPSPDPATRPDALFITAMNTDPLACYPDQQLLDHSAGFDAGIQVLARLTDGPIYLCCAPDQKLPETSHERLQVVEFDGPHPAGLPGTHIHLLRPAGSAHSVWHLGGQDVIAFGKLFTSGRLWTERVVALSGSMARNPRLLRTRMGASIKDLTAKEIADGPCRILGGSVLGGHRAAGWGGYLGRFDKQITAITEGAPREFLAWLMPGLKRYSAVKAFISSLIPGKRFPLNTSQNGSPRAMVPIGNFERVMPLDILPAPLLKALIVSDTDTAQALGCLELDEEDLALCAFVCPSKYDYGAYLRESLTVIEKEG